MLKYMAKDESVEGDVTNKSGRRTSVVKMSLKNMPRDVMCQIINHKNPRLL